jgi:hypothetical protein
MSDTPVDSSKRTWLIASACAGAVGGVAVPCPFVSSSFQPSEKAKAAGAAVEVDISALQARRKNHCGMARQACLDHQAHARAIGFVAQPTVSWPIPSQSAIRPNSRPSTPKTSTAPSSLKFWWRGHLHRTWAARPRQVHPRARSLRCLTTGRAVSCALATVPRSTWPAACSRTSLRRQPGSAAAHVSVRYASADR